MAEVTLETLDARVKELEESMSKMQVCALTIKKVVQESTGKDIDSLMMKAMEEQK